MDKCSHYVDIQQNGTGDSTGIREIVTAAFNGRVTKQLLCLHSVTCHPHLVLSPILCSMVPSQKQQCHSTNGHIPRPLLHTYILHQKSLQIWNSLALLPSLENRVIIWYHEFMNEVTCSETSALLPFLCLTL
jgi:hypothetical protein